MTAETDQRTKLVEWNDDLHTLVFKGTAVPVAALWGALREGQTFKDFLHKYSTVPIPLVLRTIRIAGELLCDWPWDSEEEQRHAYAKALDEKDLRFTSGLIQYLPGVRGGKLLSHPSLNRVDILWKCVEDGATTEQIAEWYPARPEQISGLIHLADCLFGKGLVPSGTSSVSRRRRSETGEGEA